MQLIREQGLIVIEQPRTRHRLTFRFDSRRALDRYLARVTGQPDASALEVAWQYVREGRAIASESDGLLTGLRKTD